MSVYHFYSHITDIEVDRLNLIKVCDFKKKKIWVIIGERNSLTIISVNAPLEQKFIVFLRKYPVVFRAKSTLE